MKPGEVVSSPEFVFISTAAHLGAAHERMLARFREPVLAGRVHYIGHYVNRVFELGIDVLADPGLADQLAGTAVEHVRALVQQAGQELCYHMIPLDHDLQRVRCGDVIRVMLHGLKGAIICNRVVPGENLVGFVLDQSAQSHPELPLTRVQVVEDTDRTAAAIVDSLRDEVSLGTQNPGGWSTAKSEMVPALPPGTPPGSVQPVDLDITDREDHHLQDICYAALSVQDLHYVAYHHEGVVKWSTDCFDHGDMSNFFVLLSPQARRGFYDNFGRHFRPLCRQLGRAVFPVIGSLRRIALDVEQGAVYFYSFSRTDHLVGVTLDQRRVSHADDKMAQLAVQARRMLLKSR